MAESTIEWTDFTFNPWMGCAKVSPGCEHCYAERMSNHRANWGVVWGKTGTRIRTSQATWRNPVKWNRQAKDSNRRLRVFCASLADVFEARDDLRAIRNDLFDLIRECPHLDWLLLTKRPENISRMLPSDWKGGWPNVWLGTSTEDQDRYDQRVSHLISVPSKVRFLSAEPLLGPIKIEHGPQDGINWVIAGGESGPRFRAMKLDWARAIRDDCHRLGVTFFFKQHSAYQPKALGHKLDGKTHHFWPDQTAIRRGRPKVSLLSRPEQLRIAQRKYRQVHALVPIDKGVIALVDQLHGKKGRSKFVQKAIDLEIGKKQISTN